MEQVNVPERRGGLSGLMGMFNTVAGGAKNYQSIKGMFGNGGGPTGGTTGGTTTAGGSTGAAAGGGGGGEALAGGGSSAAGAAAYAPYAAPVVAGIYEYDQVKKDPQYSWKSRQTGPSDPYGKVSGGISGEMKNITDKLDAMDRRYSASRDAEMKIAEAKHALKNSGLSTADQRNIGQKLDRAYAKANKTVKSVKSWRL